MSALIDAEDLGSDCTVCHAGFPCPRYAATRQLMSSVLIGSIMGVGVCSCLLIGSIMGLGVWVLNGIGAEAWFLALWLSVVVISCLWRCSERDDTPYAINLESAGT